MKTKVSKKETVTQKFMRFVSALPKGTRIDVLESENVFVIVRKTTTK